MTERVYSQNLGLTSDEQFQAALDRFHLGSLIQAEPIPFGLTLDPSGKLWFTAVVRQLTMLGRWLAK